MPEITVYENHHLELTQYKIGSAWQIGGMQFSSSSKLLKETRHEHFRPCILPFYLSHDRAPRSGRDNIPTMLPAGLAKGIESR